MEVLKNIYSERPITDPKELQTIHKRISNWFATQLGAKDFAKITIETVWARPSYKVSFCVEYQKRAFKQESKLYEGEKITSQQDIDKGTDVWSLSVPGVGNFQPTKDRYPVAQALSKCDKCNGGRIKCLECEAGEIPCTNTECHGTGKIPCDSCHGQRTIPCKNCWESGLKDGKTCTICKGIRKIDCPSCTDGYRPCPKCRGNRRIPCQKCERGNVPCPSCRGMGNFLTKSYVEYEVKPIIQAEVAHHPNLPPKVADFYKETMTCDGKDSPNSVVYPVAEIPSSILETFPPALKRTIARLTTSGLANDAQFCQNGYRIFAQKISIEPIMVMYVEYQYSGGKYSLWLYGENEIWDVDSPIRSKQDKVLEEGKTAAASKSQEDDVNALQKIDQVNHPGLQDKKDDIASTLKSNIKGPYFSGGLLGGAIGGLVCGLINQSIGHGLAVGCGTGILVGMLSCGGLTEKIREPHKRFWSSFVMALLLGISGKIAISVGGVILLCAVTAICEFFTKTKPDKPVATGFFSVVGIVLSWVLGLLLVLLGILGIYNHSTIAGLAFCIMGMGWLPPLNKNLRISTKIAILVVGWLVVASSIDTSKFQTPGTKQPPSSQQKKQ